jgi:hypothetical protein
MILPHPARFLRRGEPIRGQSPLLGVAAAAMECLIYGTKVLARQCCTPAHPASNDGRCVKRVEDARMVWRWRRCVGGLATSKASISHRQRRLQLSITHVFQVGYPQATDVRRWRVACHDKEAPPRNQVSLPSTLVVKINPTVVIFPPGVLYMAGPTRRFLLVGPRAYLLLFFFLLFFFSPLSDDASSSHSEDASMFSRFWLPAEITKPNKCNLSSPDLTT